MARLQKTYERRTDELRALQSDASAPGSDGGTSNADSSPPNSPPVTGAYVHVFGAESAFTAVTSVSPTPSHPHLPPGAAPPLKDALRTGQKQFNNLIQRIGGGGDHHRQQELSPGQLAVHKRREAEEADIVIRWVPRAELVAAVLDGRLQNSALIVATLAVEAVERRPQS